MSVEIEDKLRDEIVQLAKLVKRQNDVLYRALVVLSGLRLRSQSEKVVRENMIDQINKVING